LDNKRYKLFVSELDVDRNELINSTCYDTSDNFDFDFELLKLQYGDLVATYVSLDESATKTYVFERPCLHRIGGSLRYFTKQTWVACHNKSVPERKEIV